MKTQAIKLVALRPFLHGYSVLSIGDAIVTTPGHARQLIALGHAREAPSSESDESALTERGGGELGEAPVVGAQAVQAGGGAAAPAVADTPRSNDGANDDQGAGQLAGAETVATTASAAAPVAATQADALSLVSEGGSGAEVGKSADLLDTPVAAEGAAATATQQTDSSSGGQAAPRQRRRAG